MTSLFISPILTSFVNGHDLLIYLLVLYTFIISLLITFRNLCHEWTNWPSKIPTVKEKDIITWYLSTIENDEKDATQTDEATVVVRARLALRLAVERYNTGWTFGPFTRSKEDPFVQKMAIGHPFAMWILNKESGEEELPDMYTTTWFVQLGLALANQRQIVRALKEHSPFITYRYSKYDVSSVRYSKFRTLIVYQLGQNVGLFLGALMDHWVQLAMSARNPQALVYANCRARYAICFGLLYFLGAAVAVDTVLQRYWPYATKLSDERIEDINHLGKVLDKEKR